MSRGRILLAGLVMLILLPGAAKGAQDCLDCHRQATPAAVRQWEKSAHAGKVGCGDCHLGELDDILAGEARVTAETCGRCHPQALQQHRASRHGKGLQSGWGCTRNLGKRPASECRVCHQQGSSLPETPVACARFLQQSPEMGALGCNRCHEVETSCGSCHSSHGTDLAIVRNPNVCAKCHMGPDHPQWEMWQTSQHGTLYVSAGPSVGPGCQSCHLPHGGHDVSQGLTMTPGGVPYPPELQAQGRERLQRQHRRGALRDADYAREKTRLLDRQP